jgi:hypothetical protein
VFNPGVLILVIGVLGVLVATNYLTFEQSAFAVDNCDPSSTCTNVDNGVGNTQSNNCTDSSTCENDVTGNDNSQSSDCTHLTDCDNPAVGDNNIQNIKCQNVLDDGCRNIAGSLPPFPLPPNIANGNIQNIDCSNGVDFGCRNLAGGDGNTQNLQCDSIAGNEGCKNNAFGNDNTQNLNCRFITVHTGGCGNDIIDAGNNNIQDMKCLFVSIGCTNTLEGDGNELGGNEQSLLCVNSVRCDNVSFDANGNVQKSVCVNSGTCLNQGTDTKVISVKSDNCENDDVPGSKTICVNNRIINRPNS